MIIYVDAEKHCHAHNPDGNLREVEEEFFDGKCQTFIEGYCFDDSRGYVAIYPWKPMNELDAAQREYEREQLADAIAALNELGVYA